MNPLRIVTVSQVSPLEVRLDGADVPVSFVLTGSVPGDLATGERAEISQQEGHIIFHGRLDAP